MDHVTFLLPLHGKNSVYAFIDCSIQYLHALTFSLQCIALQSGKFFFRLHGLFLASYHDGDSHLMYDPGQVYGFFLCAQLTYSAIYYLILGVMTYTSSHLSGDNLPCYFRSCSGEDYVVTTWEVVGTLQHYIEPSVFLSL